MCKAAVYAANSTAQTLASGSVISFGTIVRKFGCNCSVSGGNAIIQGAGYYDIDANVTFTAGAAGTAVITLYKDGTAIPGANASQTVAADSVYSISLPALVKEVCCQESTITAIISGVAATVNNAAIEVKKL